MDKDNLKQYDYSANSNLVLPTDTSLSDKRASNEATGEVQSLRGRIEGKMGDRIDRNSKKNQLVKPEETEKSLLPKRRKRGEDKKLKHMINDRKGQSIADLDISQLIYQPKTESTKLVYGLVIQFVRKQLAVLLPEEVIEGAADEVIKTMKDPNANEEMKRSTVDELLSDKERLSDVEFNDLSNLCKRLTDWNSSHHNEDATEMEEEQKGPVELTFEGDEEDEFDDEFLAEVESGSENEIDLEDNDENLLKLDDIANKQTRVIPTINVGEPIRKEGYLEYHIKPSGRPPQQETHLRRIRDLPDGFQEAFRDFKTLNLIQSRIYRKAAESDENLLICAPTGAGKTNIAILTMLREINKFPKEGGGFNTDKFKIVYVAPIKALVQEVVESFTRRLGSSPYNLKVGEFTGDSQLTQREISRCQVIVCTPEKWDIATRKSEDRLYTKLVKLVIFDEIHLLHNDRGATLEALVARIKRHHELEGEPIRIIGLSATLPNYKDVARFIAPNVRDSVEYFDSTYRPIPLTQQYVALTGFKKTLNTSNKIVYNKVIESLVGGGQILVFVHSRLDTTKTAEFIKEQAYSEEKLGLFLSSGSSAVEKVNEYSKTLQLPAKMEELLKHGIGIHHAGLDKKARACVEDLFRDRFIKVLVSTATLAWGVNLPARTVIIKDTHVYRNGKWTDLDSLDVTQMLGRAGRPGFDKEGLGIVITQQSQVNFYMSLMTEQLPVESKLIGRLAEFVNSECVIGNIGSLDDTVRWISQTYLNSRMKTVLEEYSNDEHKARQYLKMYGIELKSSSFNVETELEYHKRKLAYSAAKLLHQQDLIDFDPVSGVMQSKELGRIASHLNCSCKTIKLFYDSIHQYTSDMELLRIFSLADEFKDVFVRKEEEHSLQHLFKDVLYPIDDKRATPSANKVNALLQMYILRPNITNEQRYLLTDMRLIEDNAARLASAIHEVVLMKGFPAVAELSLDLCRKINKRMTIFEHPLRQFPRELKPEIIRKLENMDYTIDKLRDLNADKICDLTRCDRSDAKKLYKYLRYLPKLRIVASVRPISQNSLSIELTISPDFSWEYEYHKSSVRFQLLVEDVNQEVLLHHEIVYIRQDQIKKTHFFIPFLKPAHPFYFMRMFAENWLGCDHHLHIAINPLTLPEDHIKFTQIIDQELRPVECLENDDLRRIIRKRFGGSTFNQIQTQSIDEMMDSYNDVILLAPPGSGKTTCVDLAILEKLKFENAKCAYICPSLQIAQVVHRNWLEFSTEVSNIRLGVLLLTGNPKVDLQLIEKANIVIGDPESWHRLILRVDRMKKYSKLPLLLRFQLFVFDSIHLLQSDKYSLMDVLCSKIRTVTKTLTKRDEDIKQEFPIRIITTGSSILCGDSLRSWLARSREKEPTLLHFPITTRPIRLEMSVQKFHQYDYRMRLLTMNRPVYRCITQNIRKDMREQTKEDRKEYGPVMLFVADYARALSMCELLIKYAEKEGRRFYQSTVITDQLHERKLRSYASQGVGYLYLGMNQNDQNHIEKLYDSGYLQVLVVTVSMCWSTRCRSYLTIIMDTQHHDGREGTEYELTDVMQMVGLTGRHGFDSDCKCVLMCHSSRANYYERFINEPLAVESEMPKNLISLYNYEISARPSTEIDKFNKIFLAPSFFCKRISINPNYYGIQRNDSQIEFKKLLENYFTNLVEGKKGVITELVKKEFIIREEESETPSFKPLELGQISQEFYINYETLLYYNDWLTDVKKSNRDPTRELIELIADFTREFDGVPVRFGELRELKRLNDLYLKERESVSSKLKIKLLILAQYQKYKNRNSETINDYVEGELIEDQRYVISTCYRLLMAVVEMAYLKDSFSLVKTSLKLAKALVPFQRQSRPNLDIFDTKLTKDDQQIQLDIELTRDDDPYSLEEFEEDFRSHQCPRYMYREEGWTFFVHGNPKNKNDLEKVVLSQRLSKPLQKGSNKHKLIFSLPDDSAAYNYDLYLMSDFYPLQEDRKIELKIS